MDPDRRVFLNPNQKLDEHVMMGVVHRMQNTPYVLQGGTALAFAYSLDRHPTDIDCGAGEPLNIQQRIRQGLNDADVAMSNFIVQEDTGAGQRFKVHSTNPDSGQARC